MAIAQPQSTDALNSPSHDTLHRIIAADVTAPVLSLTVDSTGLVDILADVGLQIGAGDDLKIYISSDDAYLDNVTQDKDLILRINDGGAQKALVTLDGDVAIVRFSQDTGITIGAGNDCAIYLSSDDLYIDNVTQDKDILIRVNDGGSQETAVQIHGDSGIVSIPGQSGAHANNSDTTQSNITNNTATKVALGTEVFDVQGEFAASRFTAVEAGYYAVSGQVLWQNTVADKMYSAMIYKNGALAIEGYSYTSATAHDIIPRVSGVVYLAAGQYLELYCYHFDGTNNPDLTQSVDTFLSVFKIA